MTLINIADKWGILIVANRLQTITVSYCTVKPPKSAPERSFKRSTLKGAPFEGALI